jgi:hypothetical protein
MTVPYTFAGATSSIPLSQLDTNFQTYVTLGTTQFQLGDTVTTVNGLSFSNITVNATTSYDAIRINQTGTGNSFVVEDAVNPDSTPFVINTDGNVSIGTTSTLLKLSVTGSVGFNAPVTVTAATYTVLSTDNWIIANRAGTVTLTLPAASSWSGRIITIKNIQAQTVVSATSNVVPIGTAVAGTAILAATAGKFATLVSDGTNWVIMQAN